LRSASRSGKAPWPALYRDADPRSVCTALVAAKATSGLLAFQATTPSSCLLCKCLRIPKPRSKPRKLRLRSSNRPPPQHDTLPRAKRSAPARGRPPDVRSCRCWRAAAWSRTGKGRRSPSTSRTHQDDPLLLEDTRLPEGRFRPFLQREVLLLPECSLQDWVVVVAVAQGPCLMTGTRSERGEQDLDLGLDLDLDLHLE